MNREKVVSKIEDYIILHLPNYKEQKFEKLHQYVDEKISEAYEITTDKEKEILIKMNVHIAEIDEEVILYYKDEEYEKFAVMNGGYKEDGTLNYEFQHKYLCEVEIRPENSQNRYESYHLQKQKNFLENGRFDNVSTLVENLKANIQQKLDTYVNKSDVILRTLVYDNPNLKHESSYQWNAIDASMRGSVYDEELQEKEKGVYLQRTEQKQQLVNKLATDVANYIDNDNILEAKKFFEESEHIINLFEKDTICMLSNIMGRKAPNRDEIDILKMQGYLYGELEELPLDFSTENSLWTIGRSVDVALTKSVNRSMNRSTSEKVDMEMYRLLQEEVQVLRNELSFLTGEKDSYEDDLYEFCDVTLEDIKVVIENFKEISPLER